MSQIPVTALQPYRGVKAVVLGAAGFLGRWVARSLTECQAQLSLVVRDGRRAQAIFERYGVRGRIIELNLAYPGAAEKLLSQVRPSIVFNLAAYGEQHGSDSEEMAYRTNTRLVQDLSWGLQRDRDDAEWPWQNLVHVGSAIECGGDYSETCDGHPVSFYAESKLAATCWLQRYCRRFGFRAVIARPFSVYGPGERCGALFSSLMETMRQRKLLPLPAASQACDFTYVADIAEGLLRLGVCSASPGAIVNLATGRSSTVREFVERASVILGAPPQVSFEVMTDLSGDLPAAETPVAQLRQLTGWLPPTSIDRGIRAALEFLDAPASARPTREPDLTDGVGGAGGVLQDRR